MNIWVKLTTVDNKILKQTTMELSESFLQEKLLDYLSEICSELDVATPIILSKHLASLQEYNQIVFYASDFLEQVKFHKMVVLLFEREKQTQKND